jgi:hypothetical protein
MNNNSTPLSDTVGAAQSAPLLIRWRGRQEGPYPPEVIDQKLDANEIGLLHEIYHDSKWTTLREYLADKEAVRNAQRLAREEQERRLKELEERKAREKEESQRAAALAEQRRRNDLLEQNLAGQSSQSQPHSTVLSSLQPHRGGMILTFSLLGLLVFFPLGIAAWSMGSADLAQMDAGLMDPAGRSITSSGRTIGILATALWCLGIFGYFLVTNFH